MSLTGSVRVAPLANGLVMETVSEPLLPNRPWRQRTFSALSPSGVRSTVLNFIGSTVGAGLLSLPYAVATCGLMSGVLLLLFVAFSFYFFYSSLVKTCDKLTEFTYVGMVRNTYGRGGKLMVEAAVLLFQLGVMATMNNLLCSFALHTLLDYGIDVNPDALRPRALFMSILMLVQIPMVLPEKVQALRYASGASLCCVLYVALVVLLQGPAYIGQNSEPLVWFRWDIKALDAVGVILFGFENALIVPMLYNELERRSPGRMLKVLQRGFISLTVLYLSVGVVGALSYAGPTMPSLVVLRPRLNPGEPDWLMLVGRTVYLVTLTLQVPFALYPLRLAAQQFLREEAGCKESRTQYLSLTLGFLLIPLSVATVVPEVLHYFKLLGSVFSVLLAVVFPSKSYVVMMLWKVEPSLCLRLGYLLPAVLICGLGAACTLTFFLPA